MAIILSMDMIYSTMEGIVPSDPGEVKQGQIPSQWGQTDRRLDAGEASRGGEPRVCVSGDQTAGGGHLRDADARPHRVVVAAGPGVAGVVAGDDLGGRRSSDEVGSDARGHGEAREECYGLVRVRRRR